ncbi:hypothetical protein JZ751_029416 [Albula glossodonta]|uniref:DH domain-containing protein n=1 Tax=Albula glossodonta TaxID=121402 RepID=A0A8T2PBJ8_9TELE|nr:hypothetical protein JZ751_029416 [Albula glossodonta]
MESQTLAEQMPDVKGTPCDLSASAPPAGCSMDLERRVTELPAPLSVLAGPLTVYPSRDTTAYAGLQAPPGRCPIMPAYPNSTLLTSLGLRCCSTSSVHPLKHADAQPAPQHGCPPQVCVKAGGGRLYRSMENLHWAAVSDPGIYAFSAPYGSVDSEFIFQCAPTSHWYEAPETLAFCPSRAPSRKDVPLFPQWLLPAVDEQVLNGNARRGLKEKLRLQSSRVTEPNKPLRPQVTPEELAAQRDWAPWRERDEPGLRPRPTSSRHITSPEEIKQEALRRLQLRRQNSTPDLTLRSSEEPSEVAKSRTAESLTPQTPGGASSLERRRPPVGRLHIPTFEEFKKMRRGESGQEGPKQGQHPAEAGGQTNGGTYGNLSGEEVTSPQSEGEVTKAQSGSEVTRTHSAGEVTWAESAGEMTKAQSAGEVTRAQSGNEVTGAESAGEVLRAQSGGEMTRAQDGSEVTRAQAWGSQSDSEVRSRTGQNGGGQASPWGEQAPGVERTSADSGQSVGATESPEWHRDSKREGPQPCQNGIADRAAVPICTSPTPRPPLPALSTHQQTEAGRNTANIKEDMSAPTFPHARESSEAPPSCCPALLLDGTDLSSYGAKISKMKDGFLGSALDLIKKRCFTSVSGHSGPPYRSFKGHAGGPVDFLRITTVHCHASSCDWQIEGSPWGWGCERGVLSSTDMRRRRRRNCSAEITGEAPVRLSRDQDGADITAPQPARQSTQRITTSPLLEEASLRNAVQTGMDRAPDHRANVLTVHTRPGGQTCSETPDAPSRDVTPRGSKQRDCLVCHSAAVKSSVLFGISELKIDGIIDSQQRSPGCRRSSSDAAYEPADSAKTQRECRLRPHFSDPMPADAAKRKQIEMKIAAVARLHGQRRDRDKDRDSMSDSVRERSETGGGETLSLAVTRGTQHRWSNVSSLSADSGVVGLSDEREEEDEPRQPRRNADVERVDSGIGPGLARGWKRPSASLRARELQRPCPDCGQRDAGRSGDRMCDRCQKQRTERKEAILEFLNTESSYGEDLRIIKEEFLCPMQSAGLLTAEQLAIVFSNVQELIDVNDKFTEHLQDCIDQAFDQGDEDLLTVCIGEIFLEFVNMLPAFQTYCLQQSTAVNMLNTLEKEKELLRIFLDVSQNDNTALRRMNLRSFLMAPLQRVTKYPLLLSRISKATAECHPDHARLREAKSRVESHLEHINTRTKQEGATWSLRSFRRDSRKSREVVNIEMREMSMRTVGWARESTRFVMEGPLQISQPADGQWVKKGSRALKFQNVQSLLMVHVHRASEGPLEGCGPTGPESPPELVRDGVLVLIKDKSSGKFAVLREPIRLGNCVVSADPECDDTFELLDIRREAFVLRAADKSRTQQWFRQIKRYSRDLGPWRKRRNALPNIMINTTQNRS